MNAPVETLGSEYNAWLDSLDTCECGKPVSACGEHHPSCQCCEDCGHYPCDCQHHDHDEDDAIEDDPYTRYLDENEDDWK